MPSVRLAPSRGCRARTPLVAAGLRRALPAGLAGALSVVLLLGASPRAEAQSQGFSLNRYDPAVRSSDWFSVESLDLRGHVRPFAGFVLDWGRKPLVVYNPDGSENRALVRNQLFLHFGGGLILWERLRLSLSLPVAVFIDGEGGNINGETFVPPSTAAVGDLRVSIDVRLVGRYGGPFQLALGGHLYTPTGSSRSYTGDGRVRGTPRIMIAGDIGIFTYAAQVGFQIRGAREFAGSAAGSEWLYGAAVGVRLLDKKLLIGPELFGGTALDPDRAFRLRTSPIEILGGVHYRFARDWQLGVGAGPGLNTGFGAPEVRVLASLDWIPAIRKKAPPPPPPDRDGDGILDRDDACPDVAGVPTSDPRTNGCPPPPPDRDKDGIPDPQDACPDVPGVKDPDPKKNGCPPDRDGDGIMDAEDACPDVPGVKDPDPKKNGCPPDRDKDGIADPEDACPDKPGPRNADPKKNGCPLAVIVEKEIKILEQVKFKTGSNEIVGSEDILNAVAKILLEHPEITRVRVEGHTDNVGGRAYNKRLSQRRAAAVVGWLRRAGIARNRLQPRGYGFDKPIDTNATPEGRRNNRRVEFHIVKQAKK